MKYGIVVACLGVTGCAEPTPPITTPHTFAEALRPDSLGATGYRFDATDLVEAYGSPSGGFLVHYTRTGRNAVPDTDADDSGIPDFVEQVAATYDEVLSFYRDTLGFRAPLTDNNIADNGGDARFDVYLVDFGGNGDGAFQLDNCGLLNPDQCVGYMLQENDFAGYGYSSQREAIRILGSHEFFHAIQAAYDVDQGSVLSEGTAVWATEAFDPTLTDFEWLISGYFENPDHPLNLPLSGPVDTFSYGSAIFFEFLTEQVGNTAVRTLWERVENGALGIANPIWFEVLPGLLEGSYTTNFSEVFHAFARFNLYTDSHADAVVSYPEGADFPALAMTAETAPYQDALFRVSYAASKYLTVSAGGRSEMTAALVGTAEELADLALFLAVDSGANYTQVIQLSDLTAGSERVEMNGAKHLVVGVANGSLGPVSRKPALCVGTPAEVASCRAALSPVGPVDATPDAKAHHSGCQMIAPTPLAMLLGLLVCLSARRRQFPARTTRK